MRRYGKHLKRPLNYESDATNLMTVSFDVLVLALLPALFWGISPVFSKRGMAAGGTSIQASLVLVVINGVAGWALLLIVTGFAPFTDISPATIGIFLVGGVFGTAISRLAVYMGIDRVGASINNAVLNVHPVFATFLALGWLGETITLRTGVGILVLTGGLVLLALTNGGDRDGWLVQDLAFPVIGALTYALGNVIRRFGLTTSPATALQGLALNEAAAMLVLGGYAIGMRRHDIVAAPRSTYLYFGMSGVLTLGALLSMFEALNRGPVAVVVSLSGIAPLFTVCWAALLLRDLERITKGIAVGVTVIVTGALLVAI